MSEYEQYKRDLTKEPVKPPRKCPWLVPKHRRRTIQSNVKVYLTPEEVYELITHREWDYKGGQFFKRGTQYGRDKYHSRDRAFMALMYLTSGRLNEVLRVVKSQFHEMKELSYYKKPDPDILILKDFWISKRKKGKTHPLLDLPLPRVGTLAPFTELVEKYLTCLKKKDKLFSFGESRAWVITNYITGGYDDEGNLIGKWNHWFRAQSLSYQVNLLGSALRVAKQRGVKNPTTIAHYYRGEWIVDKDQLKK
ncbi:hypothetical protein KAU30_01735 [Candidatus Bathyarchaeota archaeon]|nr:hypothetical protein [Candidatus Bathyarchaeota archaeon]